MMMMVERSFVVAILLLSPVAVFTLVQPTTDPQSGEVIIGFYNASAMLLEYRIDRITSAVATSLDDYGATNVTCCRVNETETESTSDPPTGSSGSGSGSGATPPTSAYQHEFITVNFSDFEAFSRGAQVTIRVFHDGCYPTLISSAVVVAALTNDDGERNFVNNDLSVAFVVAVNNQSEFPTCETQPKCPPLLFGLAAGDTELPPTDDGCSAPIRASFGFPLFGKRIDTFYVCANGLVATKPFSSFKPQRFPGDDDLEGVDIIAPFWADIDPQTNGEVWYHMYTRGESDRDDVALDLVDATLKKRNVTVHTLHLLVATWNEVRNYPSERGDEENTFQLVLATDGVISFSYVTYPSIEWAGRVTPATIGYLFHDDTTGLPYAFYNHPLSGQTGIEDIDEITAEEKHDCRLVLFTWQSLSPLDRAVKGCADWYFNDIEEFGESDEPPSWTQTTTACPTTEQQALRDFQFILAVELDDDHHDDVTCYESVPVVDSTTIDDLVVESICCYRLGALDDPVAGDGLSSSSPYHRLVDAALYENFTAIPHELCCNEAHLCNLFRERRPVPSRSYEPQRWSWFFGDPHVRTLDGVQYTFNGRGEYTLVQALNMTFVLEGRMRPVADSNGTAFSAFVMGSFESGTSQNLNESSPITGIVHVELDGGRLAVKGREGPGFGWTDLTARFDALDNVSVLLFNGTAIRRLDDKTFVATFADGVSVRVETTPSLLTSVFAPIDAFKGETRGLFGVWNDDADDDFTTRNGSQLSLSSTDREVHFDFGQTWQISDEDSLFYYDSGKGPADYRFPDHTPPFPDELGLSNVTNDVFLSTCNDSLACLYDAVVTNDISLAKQTLETDSLNVIDSEILANLPPTLNGSDTIRAFVNQTVTYTFTAVDPEGDSITIQLVSPANGLLAIRRGNVTLVSLTWTPTTSEAVDVQIVATDSHGASRLLQPRLLLCPCRLDLNATCNDPVGDDDDFELLTCTCGAGWDGDVCDRDLDGCAFTGCFVGVDCADLPPPSTTGTCGPCPSGTEAFDGDSCVDIDECTTGTSGCEQICTNELFSFTCSCRSGYTLDANDRNCSDINECDLATCHQTCTNSIGSFQCGCNNGFVLNVDGINCEANESCPSLGGCAQNCARIESANVCYCNRGYVLANDNSNCNDVDECTEGTAGCDHSCNNTDGSFHCLCRSGFSLNADGRTCDDVNECIDADSPPCSTSAGKFCVNSIGSYSCQCPERTYDDGSTCVIGTRPTTTTEPPPTDDEGDADSGLSTAQIVGIAAGSAGGFIFIVAIIIVVYILAKKPNTKVQPIQSTKIRTTSDESSLPSPSYQHGHGSQSREDLIAHDV